MTYLVIYRTATHVGYALHDYEEDARKDSHLSSEWMGRLYSIGDADGFTGAEAKDLYNHGVEAMAPGWGITEIEIDR